MTGSDERQVMFYDVDIIPPPSDLWRVMVLETALALTQR
jgi:hypothetical protein